MMQYIPSSDVDNIALSRVTSDIDRSNTWNRCWKTTKCVLSFNSILYIDMTMSYLLYNCIIAFCTASRQEKNWAHEKSLALTSLHVHNTHTTHHTLSRM